MIQLEKINQGNCRRSQPQNIPTEVTALWVKDPEPGGGGAGGAEARPLTWPRTHRCAAWCCLAGSAAASCTCPGLASCSRCG